MSSDSSTQSGEATVTVTTNAAATQTAPDNGRPTPPDVLGGDSVHRPGMAPGMAILDGPATMTVGAHLKGGKGKSSGGSSSGSGSGKKS